MIKIIPNAEEFFLATLERDMKMNGDDADLSALKTKVSQRTLELVEHSFYSNISVSARTKADFFLTDHQLVKGLRNLAQARLETDNFFVPYGIQLLVGDLGAAPTDTLLAAEPYTDILTAGGNINSAEFTFTVNGGKIILKEASAGLFVTEPSAGAMYKGLHVLSVSRVMKPLQRIEAYLETTQAMTTNLGASLRLFGVMSRPKS
jgi:hypothetical protein